MSWSRVSFASWSTTSLPLMPQWLGTRQKWTDVTVMIRRHRSASSLVMTCCPMAPSCYPSQCSLIISEVLWYSPESCFSQFKLLFWTMSLKVISLKSLPHLLGDNELKRIFGGWKSKFCPINCIPHWKSVILTTWKQYLPMNQLSPHKFFKITWIIFLIA